MISNLLSQIKLDGLDKIPVFSVRNQETIMNVPLSPPRAFIWRRLHSLTGVWLVLFLIIHLLENSQAALFFDDDGKGFIHGVNAIHNLPYLPVLEIILLAIPILIHLFWGIQYLFTGQFNSYASDGSLPTLKYPRNRAYTWQRITSWILLFGLIGHVIHMRFIEYPTLSKIDSQQVYLVSIENDSGLASLASRIDVKLEPDPSYPAKVIAQAKNFGTASLLIVRESFKSPLMIALYTLFVLSACFHGFNGLWTAMITWGMTVSPRSQQYMKRFAVFLMLIVTFLGLAAIWGTYWINLKN